MAVPYTKQRWVEEVTSFRYIPEEWNFLKTMKQRELMKKILPKVYDRYIVHKGYEWTASPHWTEMFEWTKYCAPREIRAIIVLMEPLPPGHRFVSTGMALGVRGPGYATGVDTVLNFLRILDGLHRNLDNNMDHNMGISPDQASADAFYTASDVTKSYVRNCNFDPRELSEQGVLFFNVALTRGDPANDERHAYGKDWTRSYDVYNIWLEFMIAVLKELLRQASKADREVVVFQFYRDMNDTIGSAVRCIEDTAYRPNLRYITVKPDFMQRGASGRCAHLGHFKPEHIDIYIREVLRMQAYFEKPYALNSKVVMMEFSPDKEQKLASRSASERERAIAKRKRKKEKRQEKSFAKLGNAFNCIVDILVTHFSKLVVPLEMDVAP